MDPAIADRCLRPVDGDARVVLAATPHLTVFDGGLATVLNENSVLTIVVDLVTAHHRFSKIDIDATAGVAGNFALFDGTR